MADRTEYQIRNLMKHNRDGPPNRQTVRLRHLEMFIDALRSRGYGKRWDIHRLGAREVHRVVSDWRTAGIGHRTIANRMVAVRWWAGKVGRADRIPANRELGIPGRSRTPGWHEDRAEPLPPQPPPGLGEREQLVTLLRAHFGLRTEEACKFSHAWATADGPDRIRLRGSWCKGGRPRDGLRHAFAQRRFEQEAGMPAPHAGGPAYSSLDAAGRERWDRAAAIVNRELGHGHGRQDITATYIGRRN